MKCVFLLLVLILSHFVMAQDIFFDKEIKELDSLIEYHRFDAAQKKADNLYQRINKKYTDEKYLEQQLRLKFNQALIADKSYLHNKSFQIFLEVLAKAEKNNFYRLVCEANIAIAFNQEKVNNYSIAADYLNRAFTLCKKHHFDDLYSSIFIRYSLLYYFLSRDAIPSDEKEYLLKTGFGGKFLDSAFHYVEKTIKYSNKYNNEYDLNEGYLTKGILLRNKSNYSESTRFYLKATPYFIKVNDYDFAGNTYNNTATNYLSLGDAKTALAYSDSAYVFYEKVSDYYRDSFPKIRVRIFDELKNTDSAYHYHKLYFDDYVNKNRFEIISKTKEIEEQYQNEKKETLLKSKNQQIILVGGLLSVIAIATVLLIIQNRRINSRNKIINKHLTELSKTLEQKQVLLSELQHRVKNNLQHVISILEIQKESVDFNNIDEVLRSNQNRIHSMALLHKKLNVTDSVNEVDFTKYIAELSELVKDSYDNHSKKITLNVKCDIKTISIEKALPLGLIITELVSNSMKHAFKKQNIGIINIEFTEDEKGKQFYYSDNGSGYDFNEINEKGLGQEIIKGLIDQLDGSIETKSNNGFELIIFIK